MEMAVATPASPTNHVPLAHEDRKQTAHRVAADMFNHTPDWITFFREVLGVDGLIRKLFPNADDLAAFEKTSEYAEIQNMLAKLRERNGAGGGGALGHRAQAAAGGVLRARAHFLDGGAGALQRFAGKAARVLERLVGSFDGHGGESSLGGDGSG
jgi:hypothetical protein